MYPMMSPQLANAEGKPSMPAPRIVLARTNITVRTGEPTTPVDNGREGEGSKRMFASPNDVISLSCAAFLPSSWRAAA